MVANKAHHSGSMTSAKSPSAVKVIQKTLRSTGSFYAARRLKPRSESNPAYRHDLKPTEAATSHVGTGALARSVEQSSTNAYRRTEVTGAAREIQDGPAAEAALNS